MRTHQKPGSPCDPEKCHGCKLTWKGVENILTRRDFRNHILGCENLKNLQCESCPLRYRYRSCLKRHLKDCLEGTSGTGRYMFIINYSKMKK